MSGDPYRICEDRPRSIPSRQLSLDFDARRRVCPRCSRDLPVTGDNWYFRAGKPKSYCKRCWNEYMAGRRDPESQRRSHHQHRPRKRRRDKVRRDGRRIAVIEAYGGRCSCCGEGHQEFLAIDHVHGSGNLHRAKMKTRGIHTTEAMCKWLLDLGCPPEFRLLCHNCNQAHGRYGYCPHTEERPWFIAFDHLRGRERFLVRLRQAKRALKMELIQAYGDRCACCGESALEFLTIDHIEGGGSRHREELRKAGSGLYSFLKNSGFPAGYQTLCMNCNFSRGKYGTCPHEAIARA